MSPRFSVLLPVAAAALGWFLHREQQRGTFESFDRKHRDFLVANPGEGKWDTLSDEPQVVFARLDDPDLPAAQRAFDHWPPAPEEWQVVFQNLTNWKPRAVSLALPLVLPNPSPGFLQTLASVPGFTLGTDAGAVSRPGFMPPVLPPGLPVLRVQGELAGIPEFETLRVVDLPVRVGINYIDLGQKISVEGEWCRVPLLARTGTQVVPTLPLQSLLTWSTVPPDRLLVQPGTAITGPNGMVIPIDESGCFRFYLPLAAQAASVQADDFLLGPAQVETAYPGGSPERVALSGVSGSLVWLGADNHTSRQFQLPDGNKASAGDLATRALAAIQTGRFIRPLTPGWQWVPQAGAALFGFWMVRWRRRHLWKGAAAGGLLLLTASLLAFQTNHTWMPIAPALLQLALPLLIGWLLPRSASTSGPLASAPPAATPAL